MRKILFMLFAILFVAMGCAPSMTPVMTPTASQTLTYTPRPTRTSSPSRTPVPSRTPSPLPTASITSTALPPLGVNKWRPQSVLVKLEYAGGDGCCQFPLPPSLVLYANGRIILKEGFEENNEWRYRLLTKTYTRDETCSILNTIDRTGFLYYNVQEYRPLGSDYFSIDGSNVTSITVNAWRSNDGKFFGLHSYLYLYGASSPVLDLPGSPPIPPALRDVYYFLESYPSEGLEIYQPQRLGLVVTQSAMAAPDSPFVDWPFDEFSLEEIENVTSVDGEPSKLFIVEGNSALSIYSHFGSSFGSHGENVRQAGKKYVVFLRPIFPYEIPQFDSWNILPDPSVKPPDFELECYPSDGILTIPTPSTPSILSTPTSSTLAP